MTAALAQLTEQLGDAVRTDPVTCENYRFDWARDPAAGTPIAVVRPHNAAEVQACVRWAAERGVPVVPRGAGSGLSGGSCAVDGGIVLSLERMRAIEIDVATRVAVVQPGAFNAEVKAAAAAHGLWYPPDPSSYEICSIGGNIATNAVEDYRPMGLDRSAGAMLITQSDAPGAACAAEIEIMEAACGAAGAKEVFVTDDAAE